MVLTKPRQFGKGTLGGDLRNLFTTANSTVQGSMAIIMAKAVHTLRAAESNHGCAEDPDTHT